MELRRCGRHPKEVTRICQQSVYRKFFAPVPPRKCSPHVLLKGFPCQLMLRLAEGGESSDLYLHQESTSVYVL